MSIRFRRARGLWQRLPAAVRQPLARVARLLAAPSDARDAMRRYIASGRRPWSPGYGEFREQFLSQALWDERLLAVFRDGGRLPAGYGERLDERVVEYPWVFGRADKWGAWVLDAGATLNAPLLLKHPVVQGRRFLMYDLRHARHEPRPQLSYVAGDLRRIVLRDGVVDTVICISTLEHVGLDNTKLYTTEARFKESRPDDYRQALHEFRRVLKPGGRLLLTVPFGRPQNLGWMQQFGQQGLEDILSEFGGEVVETAFFKYEPGGWVRSNAVACRDCEYFDVHSREGFDPDSAAAARAAACIELRKAVEART